MARGLARVAALALIATACASSSDPTSTTAEQTTTTGSSVETTMGTATTTTVAVTATTTTTLPAPTTTLAGDPVRGFATVGDELVVVGVEHDDVLNVRAGPGIASEIVATADPTGTVTATGAARDLGLSMWYGVTINLTSGWVNAKFVAFRGTTDDATAEIVAALGEIPTAGSMDELGLIVADSQVSTEPASTIVMSVAPTLGDLGEVTFDVIGLADDSIYGYRLHVFGEPVSDGFSLHTVERTALCGRGVTPDRLCV